MDLGVDILDLSNTRLVVLFGNPYLCPSLYIPPHPTPPHPTPPPSLPFQPLYVFLENEKLFNNQSFLGWRWRYAILMNDSGLLMRGEIRHWAPLGFKGLKKNVSEDLSR